MVSSKPLCSRSAPLLWLSHRSLFCLHLFKRPACSLHVTRCVSSQTCRPLQHYPHSYQPSASAVVLPPGKPPATEINGENECRSFESAKSAEESKPAPTKREWGKEWAKLNHLERCPNHWKLVIGFILPFHQRNRLPVSYPFLNCKWQQQLPI